jgi:hypothetical protein
MNIRILLNQKSVQWWALENTEFKFLVNIKIAEFLEQPVSLGRSRFQLTACHRLYHNNNNNKLYHIILFYILLYFILLHIIS